MKLEYKLDTFIPKKFIIGLNSEYCGFPSMRLKDGKWTNAAVFEKHCGYKPYTQRDAEKELMKAVTQNAQEVVNKPVSGFKLLSLRGKRYVSDLYKNYSLVKLHDPRGWNVSIDINDFQKMLDKNGTNLKDGELTGLELMYSWQVRSANGTPFTLVIADKSAAEIQAATDKYVTSADKTDFIKPSQFEVGKVYSSSVSKVAGGLYMYLGVHDVYTEDVHLKAVMRKDYSDLQEFIEDRTDITGKKHVFYCMSANPSHYSIFANEPNESPYYAVSSLSKLFERVEDTDLSKFKMHNDSTKQVSLENVQADMEESAFFNKVDLARARDYVAVDYQVLEDVFSYFGGWNDTVTALKTFPFRNYTSGMFLHGNCRVPFNIKAYGVGVSDGSYKVEEAKMSGEYTGYDYSSRYNIAEYKFSSKEEAKEAFKKLYADYAPTATQFYFENGKPVPLYQNLMLNKRTKFRDITS